MEDNKITAEFLQQATVSSYENVCILQTIQGNNIPWWNLSCRGSARKSGTSEASMTLSKPATEYQHAMSVLSCQNKVMLLWMPGHTGIRGNEDVDT
jgi:ribonuclease HI